RWVNGTASADGPSRRSWGILLDATDTIATGNVDWAPALASSRSRCAPADVASPEGLGCSVEDFAAVTTALDWAKGSLGLPEPRSGRQAPVCPFIPRSVGSRLLYVECRPEERCDDPSLVSAIHDSKRSFFDLLGQAPKAKKRLVTNLIVLPRIDRSSSADLDLLHAALKDEFVESGLMIGQFHPMCDAPGWRNPRSRPLRSPVPLFAIRKMIPSDLPFLAMNARHTSAYFERFATSIPAQTRKFLVDRLTTLSVDDAS
ncbi:MAG TPA: hypothetical protein VED63_00340, partial [Acidimicrobiales bacterium]|nr:hypothetical protein [Acidimicrobiales bacterium]